MDWLRQVPIGQYVDGTSSWLSILDPRLKLSWVLMFLLTPILASPTWRMALVIILLCMTVFSGIPFRVWCRSMFFLILLAGFVGLVAIFLPTTNGTALLTVRSPQEISSINVVSSSSWEVLKLGPLTFGPIPIGPMVINRRSAELALKSSSLVFTVVHSVNLMLLTTPPEDLMWTIRWFLSPLAFFGLPIDRISFQLLLSLRFLPLVQEELQNLLRSLVGRAINFKKLGLKASIGLFLSVGERLLANILLRAEQGADAIVARGGTWVPPEYFRPRQMGFRLHKHLIDFGAAFILLMVLGLRSKYGAM